MPTYELIITDVTQYRNLFCVAGWDRINGEMIRPEPPRTNPMVEETRFWDNSRVGPNCLFDVGHVVRLDLDPAPPNSLYPHATEDRLYVRGGTYLDKLTEAEIVQEVAAGVSPSLNTAFGGHLQRNPSSGAAYVPANTNTCSLDAIEIQPGVISFHSQPPRKLRATINDNGVQFNLSIAADAARTFFLNNGIAALTTLAQESQRIHVRLGLARPYGPYGHCYAQINGLYFL